MSNDNHIILYNHIIFKQPPRKPEKVVEIFYVIYKNLELYHLVLRRKIKIARDNPICLYIMRSFYESELCFFLINI